jgi:hypothetical protein
MRDIKVSIIFAFYNKSEIHLKNVLCSIDQQIVDFPFELIIINDGSDNKLEYKKIINSFSFKKNDIEVKYKNVGRLGFPFSQQNGIKLMDPNSKIVVIQACDIIYGNEYTLQRLVNNVDNKHYSLALVRNFSVDYDICGSYKESVEKILEEWNKTEIQDIYVDPGKPKSLLFFLGAIRKDHLLEKTPWMKNSCDAVVGTILRNYNKERSFIPIWVDDAIGIHQNHEKIWYECPVVETCKYKCIRTKMYMKTKSKIGDIRNTREKE